MPFRRDVNQPHDTVRILRRLGKELKAKSKGGGSKGKGPKVPTHVHAERIQSKKKTITIEDLRTHHKSLPRKRHNTRYLCISEIHCVGIQLHANAPGVCHDPAATCCSVEMTPGFEKGLSPGIRTKEGLRFRAVIAVQLK